MSAADLQALADSLFGHHVADSFNQKVLHGERAQATGTSPAAEQPAADNAPQIVEPQ
jgi:hypothetical protein